MKLLLTSEGLRNKTIQNALFDLVGKKPEEMAIVYVTTAFNASNSQDKKWVREALQRFEELKIGKIDYLDFAGVAKEIWLPRLERADVIYVEGGNAFHLLDKIHETGLDKELKNLLSQKVYVGASAGSMILGEKLVTSPTDFRTRDGLSVVNFSLRPHYNRPDRSAYNKEKIQQLTNELNTTYYAIDDESAISIKDGKVEVVSEGEWEKFEPREEKCQIN